MRVIPLRPGTETPTPKDRGLRYKVQSPHGAILASSESPGAAATLASFFGSHTEVWLNGQRLGTYLRHGGRRRGEVTRSEARRKLYEDIVGPAQEVEARVETYRARVLGRVAVAA